MTQVDFYDKEQIDAMEIGAPDDGASSTGSLWARIKNAVARIVSLETADANNVKKTGTNTVTGTLEVPTTPPTPTSAVNSVYVNDATEGVNNIAHKNGLENLHQKNFLAPQVSNSFGINVHAPADYVTVRMTGDHVDINNIIGDYNIIGHYGFMDKNDVMCADIGCTVFPDGHCQLWTRVRNANGTYKVNVIDTGV